MVVNFNNWLPVFVVMDEASQNISTWYPLLSFGKKLEAFFYLVSPE
jgi:hypothetical protein